MPRRFTFMEWQELSFSPGLPSLQLKLMKTRLTTTLPWVIFSACASSQSFLCACVWILPLIYDAVKVLNSICQQIWKAQQWPQDWKRSVFIPIPKKGNAKECSNYHTIALISHASKVILKILQATLQQYMNWEFPDVQAGFRKIRETRDQTANIHWIMEKAREFLKNIYFCFIDYAKAFVWITTNCGKFFKRWEYQTTVPVSWETCVQMKKQQLELDVEQWLGPNWEGICQGCILSPCLFTMQSTSCEIPG